MEILWIIGIGQVGHYCWQECITDFTLSFMQILKNPLWMWNLFVQSVTENDRKAAELFSLLLFAVDF